MILDALSVSFEVVGDESFQIHYHSPLLADQRMDYNSVADSQKPGQSRRLLAAAACACFCGTVYYALRGRQCQVDSLTGTATTSTDLDPVTGKERVVAIDIVVEVGIPESQVDLLERVRRVMADGCLVTRSLQPGIQVQHEIRRKARA